jgi:glycosyltransferase involved in cell wall biosynthesis
MSLPRRVLAVTSGALFVRGGHLVIAEHTAAALERAGVRSEVLVTPQNRFGRQLSAYLATWLTDVGQTADGHAVDGVISFRFPSYAVRHARHVCWINHRMREYYDLWERFVRGLGRRGRLKEGLRRRLFHALDRRLLTRPGLTVVAQSRTIQARLERFGGIPSRLLYPPAPERPYRNDGYGDFVFAVSRLHPLKRLDLLVEAAARQGRTGLGVRIAGDGEEAPRLRERIQALGLGKRVQLLGPLSEERLVEEYARCRAVYFAPWNEDYGFVTLEAFRSGKAVLTCPDSGGPSELVEHGRNGLVAEADAASVAAALDELDDRARAEALGAGALEAASRHGWAEATASLLGTLGLAERSGEIAKVPTSH